MSKKPTIFSGVQPSGNLHIGNYLGAISQWVDMQDEYKCIFCVVDYHAITVKQDPKELNKKISEIAKIYLASGIDPKKSIIFQQSDIKEHTELAWILNCIANAGDLKRMTQFNNKSGILSLDEQKKQFELYCNSTSEIEAEKLMEERIKMISKSNVIKKIKESKNDQEIAKILGNLTIDNSKIDQKHSAGYFTKAYKKFLNLIEVENKKFNLSSVGLFDYPVLMAADILLYNTDVVPVGDDQVQHVELTRTLARRFNSEYSDILKVPEVKIRKEGARIMGLDIPEKKMSKSATSELNYIALTDDPAKAKKKIMKATTDSDGIIKYDIKGKPGVSNLLTIYSLLNKQPINDIVKSYKGKGYGDFKKDLAEVVADFLNDFQKKYNKISDKEVKQIMQKGADVIRPIAEETVERVKKTIGI